MKTYKDLFIERIAEALGVNAGKFRKRFDHEFEPRNAMPSNFYSVIPDEELETGSATIRIEAPAFLKWVQSLNISMMASKEVESIGAARPLGRWGVSRIAGSQCRELKRSRPLFLKR